MTGPLNVYEEKKQRTRRLIQESFLRILASKPFEEITVGDIAKEADINRGTFYLHFLDKFDLLDQMEKQLFADLGQHIDELQSRYLSAQSFEPEHVNHAEALFAFIQGHAPTIKLFISDRGRAGFHFRFRRAFSEKVRLNLERHKEFSARLNVPIEYFITFITSAFLGLIEQWMENEQDLTAQEMTSLYTELIRFIQQETPRIRSRIPAEREVSDRSGTE